MINAIEKRRSVRTFKNEKLSIVDSKKIEELIKKYNNMTGPFDHQYKFQIAVNGGTKEGKIGTYGMINNPQVFLGAPCPNDFYKLMDYGYILELIVLELTNYDLGTCWLGGTFDRSMFEQITSINEFVPAVIAIGYSKNKTFKESIVRRAIKADKRKPFDVVIKLPSDIRISDREKTLLELVRKAPTASNKQPYLIVVGETHYHLFLVRTPGYASGAKYDIQVMDMGIVLSHFKLAMDDFVLEKLDVSNAQGEYVISIKRKL